MSDRMHFFTLKSNVQHLFGVIFFDNTDCGKSYLEISDQGVLAIYVYQFHLDMQRLLSLSKHQPLSSLRRVKESYNTLRNINMTCIMYLEFFHCTDWSISIWHQLTRVCAMSLYVYILYLAVFWTSINHCQAWDVWMSDRIYSIRNMNMCAISYWLFVSSMQQMYLWDFSAHDRCILVYYVVKIHLNVQRCHLLGTSSIHC